MKTRPLVSIMILVVVVLIIGGSCATGKKAYVAQDDEELYGTWVNPEYENSKVYTAPKIVVKPDGTFDEYALINSDRVVSVLEYTITDKWTDSEGNTWYKLLEIHTDSKVIQNPDTYYVLSRIDKTGNIWEMLWASIDYPAEFEPDNVLYNYRIRYRQE